MYEDNVNKDITIFKQRKKPCEEIKNEQKYQGNVF